MEDETHNWDTFLAYPPEALTKKMVEYHRQKGTAFAAALGRIATALKNRELNPKK